VAVGKALASKNFSLSENIIFNVNCAEFMKKENIPILISNPRCGSTWVHSYIRAFYCKVGLTLPSYKDDEFFATHYLPEVDIKQKIQIIENLKASNLELCHKIHVGMFLNNNVLWSWFKEFYKDYRIIILKRRNIWKTYISWLFHSTIKNTLLDYNAYDKDINVHPWHKTNLMSEDVLKSTIQTYSIEFKHNNAHLHYFTNSIRFLHDEIIPTFNTKPIFWLEDLTDEMLINMFGVEIQQHVTPFNRLNYESYFAVEQLDILKTKFTEKYDNEFQYYGYKY